MLESLKSLFILILNMLKGIKRTFLVASDAIFWKFVWELGEKCCVGKKVLDLCYMIIWNDIEGWLKEG